MEICDMRKCTGCEACLNVCKFNAIQMVKSQKGFLYPKIFLDACAICNGCVQVCPANNPIDQETRTVKKVFAAWNRDKHIRFNSSSGGVFSVFAECVINDNGVVFGARWDTDFSVVMDCVETIEEVSKLRGSKYQQAKIGDSYKKAKSLLKDGRLVFFSGTPCIIHGLKRYLGRHYPKLITLDLVCHGVPSPMIFQHYKTYLEKEYNSKIKEINLRYKKPGWSHSSTRIIFENEEKYQKCNFEDFFFVGFCEDIFLRDCCSDCAYTHTNRVGDITLSDFWGYLPKKLNMTNFELGCSAVLINTKTGMDIFQRIKNHLVFQERTIAEVMRGNRCLSESFQSGDACGDFWNDYACGIPFEMLAHKYFKGAKVKKQTALQKMKRRYRGFMPELLVSFIKNISS